MAIIFPANCKGVTAGALRELKQRGYTTASKGLWTTKSVVNLQTDIASFLSPTEPAGEFMDKIETAKQQIAETTDAISKSSHHLVDVAREANKQMNDVSGKMRDGADKLSFAIDKMMKIASRGDFAETVKLTESLVSSLERLAELEKQGKLDKVIQAMLSQQS